MALLRKKINNRIYYYYTETRRINGKPKLVKQVYLGPAEEIYRRFTQAAAPDPLEVEKLSFGGVAALWGEVQRLGLIEAIDQVVPQHPNRQISVGTYLVVGAINRAVQPTSKNGVGRWMKRTVLPRMLKLPAEAFDSQSFWDAMDLVEERHIPLIEERVWEKVLGCYQVLTDVLLYDTTNFATHLDSLTVACQLAQPGKSKDGKDGRRLLGLALACTQGLGLPVLHQVYPGNRHDARLFPQAITALVERLRRLNTQTEGVTLVFDKGNNSGPNVQLVNGEKLACVGSLKPSHFPRFLKVPLSRYTERAGECLLYRTRARVFEAERVVVVVFNPATQKRQAQTFHRQLELARKELERRFREDGPGRAKDEVLAQQYTTYLEKKGLAPYLKVKITGKRRRKLLLQPVKRAITSREKTFGKTILFCDREDWSSQKIMETYNQKYLCEENFRFLKARHYLRFDPVYHWTDQKIRVHALMCVLALLLVKLLLYRLKQEGLELNVNLLLDELNDIDEVVLMYPEKRVCRKLTKMSSVQARIFAALDLATYAPSG